MREWLLEFEGVGYTYPMAEKPALNELTLRLPVGKKSALIGQNGCGKSTLFLLADGLYKPQKGTVRWQGNPLQYDRRSLTKIRQQIGLVFQDPEQQLVAPTVEEDISYGLCNLGLKAWEIEQRLEQVLVDFELQELANRPVHHLSLGQKKRVAIAGVMVMQPSLLLLDEPTAYLDPLQTRQLMTKLEQIHETGITQLIATHDLDLAYQWADWIFVMDRGQLILEGEPPVVFACRQVMEELQLGVPLLWEVWEALPDSVRSDRAVSVPRTVERLRYFFSQIRVDRLS